MSEERKQLLLKIEPLFDSKDIDQLKALLKNQRESHIAELVEFVDNDRRRLIFDALDKEVSAEVLEKVDEATRGELFEVLGDDELAKLVFHLDPDDAADVLMELPKDEVTEVLDTFPADEADQIIDLMSYSEDTAGGIMDPIVISVQEDATIAQAISKIRAAEIDEDFFSVYVVDTKKKFLGDVRIRLLLTSKEDTKISSLIDSDTIYVFAQADQEEVRNIFSKNDLIVAPVLNKNHQLIGRITADRIIEVAEEEAAEDLYAMAGTNPNELDDVSVVHAARVRMTWLLPCLIGTCITALVMVFFKNHNPIIYLAAVAFVPMIAAISGNAGLQTSAIVVSGLATGHFAAQRLSQVFNREVRIAVLVAISCGVIGGILCTILMYTKAASQSIDPIKIVFAFAFAMFSAIMVATTLGLFLPFLFRKIGIDPAISAGPLVTTANDSISVAIYMTLTLLLAG
ncbi:MAG: magnesium transporter [Planctomycetes bacterium]|nr:magnesium transporter [Planctomycetota bacterium]